MSDDTPDTLSARLLADQSKRPRLLSDCERLIDEEVDAKGGLTGLAIKASYKVVRAIKPGFIREALDNLLDDFVARLEPFFAEHRGTGGDPKAFGDALVRRKSEVADALLGITDDRARRAQNQVVKSAYEKLRPQGKKHVEEAMPRVARTLSQHL
jgi:hypothetical protein